LEKEERHRPRPAFLSLLLSELYSHYHPSPQPVNAASYCRSLDVPACDILPKQRHSHQPCPPQQTSMFALVRQTQELMMADAFGGCHHPLPCLFSILLSSCPSLFLLCLFSPSTELRHFPQILSSRGDDRRLCPKCSPGQPNTSTRSCTILPRPILTFQRARRCMRRHGHEEEYCQDGRHFR